MDWNALSLLISKCEEVDRGGVDGEKSIITESEKVMANSAGEVSFRSKSSRARLTIGGSRTRFSGDTDRIRQHSDFVVVHSVAVGRNLRSPTAIRAQSIDYGILNDLITSELETRIFEACILQLTIISELDYSQYWIMHRINLAWSKGMCYIRCRKYIRITK